MLKKLFSETIKKLSFSLEAKLLAPAIVTLFLVGFAIPVQAAVSDNVSGFAWSNMYRATGDPLGPHDLTIGWISLNCNNPEIPAPRCVAPNDYGVNIDSVTGAFSGYAWSENIGWISFAPAGPYPALPNYSARIDLATGEISGWARVLANGGGWDGWIKLRGTNYGVSVNRTTGAFSGYAWSDMVVGWISFSGSNYGAVTTLSFNDPPNEPGIPLAYLPDGVSWNNCSFQGVSTPTFHWTYSDPDSDPQSAYEIEIDDNAAFLAPKFNHLVNLIVPSPSDVSYVLDLSQDDPVADWISQLSWGTNYFWRAKVRDNQGNWSAWSSPHDLETRDHAYPWPKFTWTPTEPTQGETVSFNPDSSTAYGGAVISSYSWSIIQGTGNFVDSTSASSRYPKIQFSTSNNKVKLQITDDPTGYSCGAGAGEGESENDITAELPLPEYKEVPPTSWLKRIFAGLAAIFRL